MNKLSISKIIETSMKKVKEVIGNKSKDVEVIEYTKCNSSDSGALLVVTDGTLTDENTQIEENKVVGIAIIGEYVLANTTTTHKDSTGIYKYIDDKMVSEGDGTFLTEDIEVKGIIDGFGYADGDIISKETTSNDFVKKLMRRVVHPNYIAPTLSFTASPSIVEIGVDTEITFTPTYVQNDAGSLIEFIVNQDSTPTYSDTTSVSQFSKNYTLAGDSMFEANVEYEDGIIKQNNFGEDDEVGRILANIISKSVTVKAVYPYYVGVLDTLDETNIKTLTKKVEVKENKDIAFTTTGLQTVVFAYPKSYGVLSSIINQNNYEVISNFTKTDLSIDSIDYYVYSLPDVNLNNFKYSFKY